MELYSDINTIIAKLLAIEADTITKEAHLHFDLGADSLALENLAIAISEKYGIELMGEDLVDLESVEQLVSLVESKIHALK